VDRPTCQRAAPLDSDDRRSRHYRIAACRHGHAADVAVLNHAAVLLVTTVGSEASVELRWVKGDRDGLPLGSRRGLQCGAWRLRLRPRRRERLHHG